MNGRGLFIKGFSLIEMLVVISVFSVLIILATQSLSSSLRGAKKSESLINVKENLDNAVGVMERQIHNATSISPCSGTRLDYIDQYRKETYFECLGPAGSQYVASGSGAVNVRLTSDKVNLTTCQITCNAPAIGTNELPSVDINLVGVSSGGEGVTSGKISVTTRVYLRSY